MSHKRRCCFTLLRDTITFDFGGGDERTYEKKTWEIHGPDMGRKVLPIIRNMNKLTDDEYVLFLLDLKIYGIEGGLDWRL